MAGASIDEYQAARDGNDNNFADGGVVDKDNLRRQRQGGAAAINQTKENIGGMVDQAGSAIAQAGKSAFNSVAAAPAAAYDFASNTTFDNRLPRQDIRDQRAANQSAQWAGSNPDQALSAQQGMQGVADRATAGLNIPPSPLPGVGGYDPANPASPKPAAPALKSSRKMVVAGFSVVLATWLQVQSKQTQVFLLTWLRC